MNKPFVITLLLLVIGMGLLASGVFLIFGAGPALVVLSAPFLFAGGVLVRGMTRV
jgi:hypothetical protein